MEIKKTWTVRVLKNATSQQHLILFTSSYYLATKVSVFPAVDFFLSNKYFFSASVLNNLKSSKDKISCTFSSVSMIFLFFASFALNVLVEILNSARLFACILQNTFETGKRCITLEKCYMVETSDDYQI